MSRNLSLVAWLVLLIGATPALGEDALGSSVDGAATETTARIAELDHPSFDRRQAASEQLAELGASAVSKLEKVVGGGSREAASRSLNILKKHFQSGEEETRTAARQALERLAGCRNVGTAQRARDILNPPQPVAMPARRGWRPPPFAPFNVMPGGAVGNAAAPVRQIRVTDDNGRKTLRIEEGGRIVAFEILPGGGLAVEVTDKQNVANPPRKLDARDADDLKQKDPELARLFETHQPMLQVIGGARPAAPIANPAAPPLANPAGRPIGNGAEAARAQIAQLDEMINRFRQRAQTEPAMQRSLESLERLKAHLEQGEARLAR